MDVLMRVVFTLLFTSSLIFASTISNSLLEIHATIMPKVLMLEHNIEKKIKNNKIKITLAYESSSYKDMKFLKRSIEEKYPNGISGYKIEIATINYTDFNKCDIDTNLLYIFPSSKENVEKLLKGYNSCNAVTFACKKEYLANDAMISIDVGKQVKPIVNLQAVKRSGISFKPVLLSISKVYTEND
jgi:hypothetical protein